MIPVRAGETKATAVCFRGWKPKFAQAEMSELKLRPSEKQTDQPAIRRVNLKMRVKHTYKVLTARASQD
jgi:hypothetical protein